MSDEDILSSVFGLRILATGRSQLEKISRLFHYYVDMQGIDGIVNGVGTGVQKLGAGFRKLQNGNIEYYLIGMVAGVVLLLLTLFF